ncbi:Leukotriene A-4 hydrolase [Saguinus oedipus]|uniref:Leukotriene A-4 hydrolase n=1 Tax=Saguinus oedipus TaxID=9490 RepID=A0ABQ9UZ44_SAGOE|nr:Leukotriene A-4 hydrolase [Saguinus oedipus]
MPEVVDTCSLASPASVCRTKHLHLRCSVDFTRRTLTGTAALTVQSQEDNLRSLCRLSRAPPRPSPIALRPCGLPDLPPRPLPSPTSPSDLLLTWATRIIVQAVFQRRDGKTHAVPVLSEEKDLFRTRYDEETREILEYEGVLDTKDLTIEKVVINGQEVKYALGERQSYKGSPMEISLPIALSKNQEIVIEISFETSPKSSALQWLTPEQTSGKEHPYLFSQCQKLLSAIHCRAVLPCQDTPSVKLTYTAEVSVPKELVALMSAIRDGEAPDPEDPSRKIYKFIQKKEKDKHTGKTESMLKIAEDLGGPYVWGQYDLLVLPPSFPYGGMENPCLTFVTPTLLAGDKSLSNVIAHEISHSWTGNLVTNKTWDHFWLNEGHTVYLERHICGRLFGEKFRHFNALGGWGELQNSVKTFGETHPFTKLVVDLTDVDPDVAYSSVPYEKGFALLFYLEQLLGGPEVFLGFLKAYVEKFSYKSITTDDWKDFLYSHFKDKVDVLNQVDWNAWLYSPGLPPIKPNYDMTLTNACIALSQRWITAKEDDLNSFNATDLKDLSSHQLNEFLAQMLQKAPLPLGHIKRMQEVYNFNAINNSEIRFRDLAAFDKSHDQAVRTYQEHKASMHPVTAMLVGKDLKVD